MDSTRKKAETEPAAPPGPAGSPAGAPAGDLLTILALGMAFLSGAALMTLEIVGGRVVASRFGSHVFVWGGVIGIFMGALSLGYYFGGKAADRHPKLFAMGLLTALSGVAVALVPLIAGPVCRFMAASLFTSDFELANRWNPLVAVILIFSVPSILLGSITPFTIRLSARDVSSMGGIAARVYAVNAIGSIAGTIITAFILMSYIGNSAILLSVGIFLAAIGIGCTAMGWMRGKHGRKKK
jgi:hypothetical protein